MGQSSRTQHAELVPFWISHNDPGDISLADVNSGGPEFLQALDLHVLIIRAKVEVDIVEAARGVTLSTPIATSMSQPPWTRLVNCSAQRASRPTLPAMRRGWAGSRASATSPWPGPSTSAS